jgi:hypothetical protein
LEVTVKDNMTIGDEDVLVREGQLEPAIADYSGYRIRLRDLSFLGISPAAIELWRARTAPLGMSIAQFDELKTSLVDALHRDDIRSADIRLKGSSTTFFSGRHKQMPATIDGVGDLFIQLRGRLPTSVEVEEILGRFDLLWPDGKRPSQRPFDSMWRLGIDRDPSDYDLQVSSDEIYLRARDTFTSRGMTPAAIRVRSPKYDFMMKYLVAEVCPYLHFWSLHRSDVLQRQVTIAVFDAAGPPDRSSDDDGISSHFRSDDWIIYRVQP